jgi:hypothetical protein
MKKVKQKTISDRIDFFLSIVDARCVWLSFNDSLIRVIDLSISQELIFFLSSS